MGPTTIEVQQERFESLLLAGREDQILTEFLSAEFTHSARENNALAPVCVRALGVLVWYDPARALAELATWQDLDHPEMQDLVLAIQANAYMCDVWNRVRRSWSVPPALDHLVKYAHVVSEPAHADLLIAVGKDLQSKVPRYLRTFDWLVERGDQEVLRYIESLSFFGHEAAVDETSVLADRHGDLCEALARVAESASVFSNAQAYGLLVLISGATMALSRLLTLDTWVAVTLGAIAGMAAYAAGLTGKSRKTYYRDVLRPHLGRAYARHGCQDHELLVAWIRMNPRVAGLYPFHQHYCQDHGLRLLGTLAAGARDAAAWRQR